jgi:hypothetical protein
VTQKEKELVERPTLNQASLIKAVLSDERQALLCEVRDTITAFEGKFTMSTALDLLHRMAEADKDWELATKDQIAAKRREVDSGLTTDHRKLAEDILELSIGGWTIESREKAAALLASSLQEATRSLEQRIGTLESVIELNVKQIKAAREATRAKDERIAELEKALSEHTCLCDQPYHGAQRIGTQHCERCGKCWSVGLRAALSNTSPPLHGSS